MSFRKGNIIVESDRDDEPLYTTFDGLLPEWKFGQDIIHWTEFYIDYSVFKAGYIDENKKLATYANSVHNYPGSYMCGRRIAYGYDKVAYAMWFELAINSELDVKEPKEFVAKMAYSYDGVTWHDRSPEGVPLFPPDKIDKCVVFDGRQNPLRCEFIFIYRPPMNSTEYKNCVRIQDDSDIGWFFVYYINRDDKKCYIVKSRDLKTWTDPLLVNLRIFDGTNYLEYKCTGACNINSFTQEFYKNNIRPASTSLTDWLSLGNYDGMCCSMFVLDESNERKLIFLKQSEVDGAIQNDILSLVQQKKYPECVCQQPLKACDMDSIGATQPDDIQTVKPWDHTDANIIFVMDNTASTLEDLEGYKFIFKLVLMKHYKTATYLNVTVVAFSDDPTYVYDPSKMLDPSEGWVAAQAINVGYADAVTAIENINFTAGGDLPEPTYDALHYAYDNFLSHTATTGHINIIYFATDQCGKTGVYQLADFLNIKQTKTNDGYLNYVYFYTSVFGMYSSCDNYNRFIENHAPGLLQNYIPDYSASALPTGNLMISTYNGAGSGLNIPSDAARYAEDLYYYSSSNNLVQRNRKVDFYWNPKVLDATYVSEISDDSKYLYCITSAKDETNIYLTTFRIKIDSVNDYPKDGNYIEKISETKFAEYDIVSFRPSIDSVHGNYMIASISNTMHSNDTRVISLYNVLGFHSDGTPDFTNIQWIANPDLVQGEVALISPVAYYDGIRWVINCIAVKNNQCEYSGTLACFHLESDIWTRVAMSTEVQIFSKETYWDAIKHCLDIDHPCVYSGGNSFVNLIFSGIAIEDGTDIMANLDRMLKEDVPSSKEMDYQTSREKLYKIRVQQGYSVDTNPQQYEVFSFPHLYPAGYNRTLSYIPIEYKKCGFNMFTFQDKSGNSRKYIFTASLRQFCSAIQTYIADDIVLHDTSEKVNFGLSQIITLNKQSKFLNVLPDIGKSNVGLFDYCIYGPKTYTTAFDGFGTSFIPGKIPWVDLGISISEDKNPLLNNVLECSANFIDQDYFYRQPVNFCYGVYNHTDPLSSEISGMNHICFYTRQIDYKWKLFCARSSEYGNLKEWNQIDIPEILEIYYGSETPIISYMINPFEELSEGNFSKTFYLLIGVATTNWLIKTEDFGLTWKIIGQTNLPKFQEINSSIINGYNPDDKTDAGKYYRYDYLLLTERSNEHSYIVSYKRSNFKSNADADWLIWERVREVYISNHEDFNVEDIPKLCLAKNINGDDCSYNGYIIGLVRNRIPYYKIFKIVSDPGRLELNNLNHHYLKITEEIYDLGEIQNLPKFTKLEESLEDPNRLIVDTEILNSLRIIKNSNYSAQILVYCGDPYFETIRNFTQPDIRSDSQFSASNDITLKSKESIVFRSSVQASNFNDSHALHYLCRLSNGNYMIDYHKMISGSELYKQSPFIMLETSNEIVQYFSDRSYGQHFRFYILTNSIDKCYNLEFKKCDYYLTKNDVDVDYEEPNEKKYHFSNGEVGFYIYDRLLNNELVIIENPTMGKFKTSPMLESFEEKFMFSFDLYNSGTRPVFVPIQYPYIAYSSSLGHIEKLELQINSANEIESTVWYGQPSICYVEQLNDEDSVSIKTHEGLNVVNCNWNQFYGAYEFIHLRSRAYIVGNKLYDISLNFDFIEENTYQVSFMDPEKMEWSNWIDVLSMQKNVIEMNGAQIDNLSEYINVVAGSLVLEYRIKKLNYSDKIFFDLKPHWRMNRSYYYQNKFHFFTPTFSKETTGMYYQNLNQDDSHFTKLTGIALSKGIRNLEYQYGEDGFYNWDNSPIRCLPRDEELDRLLFNKLRWLSGNTVLNKPINNLHTKLPYSPTLWEEGVYEQFDKSRYASGYQSSLGANTTIKKDTSVIFSERNLNLLPSEPDLSFNLKKKNYIGNTFAVPPFVYNTTNKRSILLYYKDMELEDQSVTTNTYGLYLKYYARTEYGKYSKTYEEYSLGTTNLYEFYFYMPSPKLGKYEFTVRYNDKFGCANQLVTTVIRDDFPMRVGLPEKVEWEDTYYDSQFDRISVGMRRRWSSRPDALWDENDNWYVLYNEFYENDQTLKNKVFGIPINSIFRNKYIIWKNAADNCSDIISLHQEGINLNISEHFACQNRDLKNYDKDVALFRFTETKIEGYIFGLTNLMRTSIKSFSYL